MTWNVEVLSRLTVALTLSRSDARLGFSWDMADWIPGSTKEVGNSGGGLDR